MRLIPKPFEFSKQNPFAHDVLDRREFAESLLELVRDCEHELVIALEGEWGEGKSTFVRQWQCMLNIEEHDIPSVYFDAFEMDHHDDAFSAIASVIYKALNEKPYKDQAEKRKFNEKLKDLGKRLAPVALKTIFHLSTFGALSALRTEHSEDVIDAFTQDYSEAMSEHFMARVTSFDDDQKVVSDFRKNLFDVTKINTTEDGQIIPLVIIIDELDRCKPTYALSVLEMIKHFFSVPTLRFVLVMQSDALIAAVKQKYGIDNGFEYLQKFIHLNCRIPKRDDSDGDIEDAKSELGDYIIFLFESFIEPEKYGLTPRTLAITYMGEFAGFCRTFRFSKRQIEKALTYLSIYLWRNVPSGSRSATHEKEGHCIRLVVFLCTFKVFDYSSYRALVSNEISFSKINETHRMLFQSSDQIKSIPNIIQAASMSAKVLEREDKHGDDKFESLLREIYRKRSFSLNLVQDIAKDIDLFATDKLSVRSQEQKHIENLNKK